VLNATDSLTDPIIAVQKPLNFIEFVTAGITASNLWTALHVE
jgi:hypothetical protein